MRGTRPFHNSKKHRAPKMFNVVLDLLVLHAFTDKEPLGSLVLSAPAKSFTFHRKCNVSFKMSPEKICKNITTAVSFLFFFKTEFNN